MRSPGRAPLNAAESWEAVETLTSRSWGYAEQAVGAVVESVGGGGSAGGGSVGAGSSPVTVTLADALTVPFLAVTRALPAPWARTTPLELTVATLASEVVHVSDAPLITAPPASVTTALSRV